MTRSTFTKGVLALCVVVCATTTAKLAHSQNWMLIETHDLPGQCSHPIDCIAEAELSLRNLVHLNPQERQTLLQVINQISVVRGVPDENQFQSTVHLDQMIQTLHPLPKAEKLATLVNHPGVYFDSSRLDENEVTAPFSDLIRSKLSAAGVRLLTKEELEVTPGRPTLSVHFSPGSESEGCIIPFAVSMSISEETVMVRNPSLKILGKAWSGQARQNLANRNYTPISALTEVMDAFIADWRSQNP